jgi:hypothetical protein
MWTPGIIWTISGFENFEKVLQTGGSTIWSAGQFLDTDPEVLVRFPALPDFLRSGGYGTGFTQPRE